MLFFDWNAATPLHPAARRAWLDVVDRAWHNPGGLYAAATAARELLDDCRERLATLLGCDPERIVFTAGATAANNAVARHVCRTSAPGARAVLSPLEHPCVAEPFAAGLPGRVVELPVDAHGTTAIAAVGEALERAGGHTAIVAVMAASNESGTIQPWREIAALCRRQGVPFLTDASQWLGKLPARNLGECDWVTGSGHKFGGPKGVGFILVPDSDRSFQGDVGGPQEAGRNAGTEDVASIAAMVAALEARESEIATGNDRRAAARDAAQRRLGESLPDAVFVGAGAPRLWNTLAIVVPGADGRKIVARMNHAGVAASTGSACSAGAGSTARVFAAIGAERLGIVAGGMHGMVRLSAGWDTTADEWLAAADAVAAAVHDMGQGLPRLSLSDRP